MAMSSLNLTHGDLDVSRDRDAFRDIALKVSFLANSYGLALSAYHSADLVHFSELKPMERSNALSGLKAFLETLESTQAAGFRLDNQPQLVWHALKIMGLKPPSDLFRYIQPEHVIEIYSMEGLQIWRNLNFLKFCSYTLEEVYSIPFHMRYARQPDRIEEVMTKVGLLLTGQTDDIYHSDITDHRIEETMSAGRFVLSVSHNWLARLQDRQGHFGAWMGISNSKLVASRSSYRPSVEQPGLTIQN